MGSIAARGSSSRRPRPRHSRTTSDAGWDSTGVDVTGDRFVDVRPSLIPDVLSVYPRLTFKRDFAAAFADQAARKPSCKAADMVRTGMLQAIADAPFDG